MWNKKSMMRLARKNGFTGNTADELIAWMSENGVVFEGLDTPDKIKAAFSKTVTITADAGEDIVLVEPETPEGGLEDAETLMEDEEDDAEMKDFRAWQRSRRKDATSLQNGKPNPAAARFPGHKKIGDAVSIKKSAYDRAIKAGSTIIVPEFGHKTPLFYDADRAEYYGARVRLGAMKSEGYSQRANDEAIVARYKGSTSSLSSYGALVYYEELPELIENFDDYGAIEAAVGVTNMRDGEQTVGKLTADVTVYNTAEGAAATPSDASATNVKLVSDKTSALSVQNREILDDSAFNIAEIIARSAKRAMAQYQDSSCILGQNGYEGILDIIVAGGANVHDTASGGWQNITVADIQDVQAKAPSWVYKDPKCGWMCSMAFAQSTFYRFGLAAGGNTGQQLHQGFQSSLSYNGYPVYISEVMNGAYGTGDDIPLLFGAWSHACRFGRVRGSQEMRSSSDRYFEQDKVAFRYDERWAFNPHDVSASASGRGSGIVGLQD